MFKKMIIFTGVLLITLGMSRPPRKHVYETAYGKMEIEERVLIELIEHPVFQRLKKIHQYGVGYHIHDKEWYSRYDHSMGVLFLLRYKGCPLKEQVAGLLHDVSHTAFSHLGDIFFGHNSDNESYQDTIHTWFLKESKLADILNKYGLTPEEVEPLKENFPALEQDLPDLCADRIDYNLQGAYLRGMLTKEEMMEIFHDLQFDGEKWSFSRIDFAKKLSSFPLMMTFSCWDSLSNYFGNYWLTKALKVAIYKGIISLKDINLGNDVEIWHLLTNAQDPQIKKYMQYIEQVDDHYRLVHQNEDMFIPIKFRGINPWIRSHEKYLTELDKNYAKQYFHSKSVAENGWKIQMKGVAVSQQKKIVDNAKSKEAVAQ